jgi:group I intron endonuclease
MVIYKIQNKVNGKIYIGSTKNKRKRWNTHKRELRTKKHANEHLRRAWNKYGERAFLFEVIEEVPGDSTELLHIREQHYLDTLNPDYNICKVAGSPEPRRGEEHYGAKLTWEKVGVIREKYYKGSSYKELAEEYGIGGIGSIIENKTWKDENYEYVSLGSSSRAKRGEDSSNATLDRESITKILNEYKNTSLTLKEIGKKYKVNSEAIEKVVKGKTWSHLDIQIDEEFIRERRKKVGLQSRPRGENHKKSKLTWEKVREIRNRYSKGDSLKSLAKKYEVSDVNITSVVRNETWYDEDYRYVQNDNSKYFTPKLSQEQKQQIRELYKKGNTTYKELATIYGVGKTTIVRALKN